MFKRLRWRLSLLYCIVGLLLITSIGGGTYLMLARYFENVVDLALQHKMTHEFHLLAAPIPTTLSYADRDWSIIREELAPLSGSTHGKPIDVAQATELAKRLVGESEVEEVRQRTDGDRLVYEVRFLNGGRVRIDAATGRVLELRGSDADDTQRALPAAEEVSAAAYDAELAAIFVLPLSTNGEILFDPNSLAPPPIEPNQEALGVALAQGYDLRTMTDANGESIRLLTYRLTRSDGPAVLQLGRVLTDQQLILNQLIAGLLIVGGIAVGLFGLGSWWLAGRSIQPMQQAWIRQQQFVASASHELRTPLTLIRASAEVALRGLREQPEQQELLHDVVGEVDHMRRLVDDLLTLSRLDAHQIQLARQVIEPTPLLEELRRHAERLDPQATRSIIVQTDHASILADRDRLRQVLLILLDNALRYTPAAGQISLSSMRHGKMIQVAVHDTGCGIAPEHLPHIFERFYRVDQSRGVSNNSGLGLAIAKSLIEEMGGRIAASSTPAVGTTITITLPSASGTGRLEH